MAMIVSDHSIKKHTYVAIRAAVSALVVVMPVFWAVGQLGSWWTPPLDAVVFAVVLAVGLPRAIASVSSSDLPLASSALLLGTAAATGCGMLLTSEWRLAAGAGLFAVGASTPVWLRRFGRRWRITGPVAALPFLAVLIHPQPDLITWTFLGWMLVAAGIAFAWSAAVHFLSVGVPRDTFPTLRIAAGPARGLAASTRMAIQLAISVVAAFALGQWIDPSHLVWPVMSAIIVHSGNRGRGDVLVKGAERTVGAIIGTLVATLVGGALAPGDTLALVIIFAALILGNGLAEIGYTFRTACTTAALAFFYGYFGESGSNLLSDRLLGLAGGAAIGIAAAWFLVPLRTTDVTRRRVGVLLAAAAVVATPGLASSDHTALERLSASDREVAALIPTLAAARRFGIGAARKLHDTATGARSLAQEALASASGTDHPDDNSLEKRITRARLALKN